MIRNKKDGSVSLGAIDVRLYTSINFRHKEPKKIHISPKKAENQMKELDRLFTSYGNGLCLMYPDPELKVKKTALGDTFRKLEKARRRHLNATQARLKTIYRLIISSYTAVIEKLKKRNERLKAKAIKMIKKAKGSRRTSSSAIRARKSVNAVKKSNEQLKTFKSVRKNLVNGKKDVHVYIWD